MSGYYYLNDPEGDLGYTPVSENEMVGSIFLPNRFSLEMAYKADK